LRAHRRTFGECAGSVRYRPPLVALVNFLTRVGPDAANAETFASTDDMVGYLPPLQVRQVVEMLGVVDAATVMANIDAELARASLGVEQVDLQRRVTVGLANDVLDLFRLAASNGEGVLSECSP
jgi:hypothetical protein